MSQNTAPRPTSPRSRASLSEKLLRGDVMAADCPSRQVLNHLTSRWGVLALIALLQGTLRFSQLKRLIGGVSERMLAQTLQQLEGDGMIQRHAYPVVPPRVEYALTPLGREAAVKVRELADWIEVNMPNLVSCPATAKADSTADGKTP